MWNNGGCQQNHGPSQQNQYNPCCAYPNPLYVFTTPWVPPSASSPCTGTGLTDPGQAATASKEDKDKGQKEKEEDMGPIGENVPSDAEGFRCIEKLQHIVLARIRDPNTSLKCLQNLHYVKKTIRCHGKAKQKKGKGKGEAEKTAKENTKQNSKKPDGRQRGGSRDSSGSESDGSDKEVTPSNAKPKKGPTSKKGGQVQHVATAILELDTDAPVCREGIAGSYLRSRDERSDGGRSRCDLEDLFRLQEPWERQIWSQVSSHSDWLASKLSGNPQGGNGSNSRSKSKKTGRAETDVCGNFKPAYRK